MSLHHQQSQTALNTVEKLDDDLHQKEIRMKEKKEKEKLSDDLNFVLVIVGLLSAVITSFMLYVQPKLDRDPNDEIIGLLRLIVYNGDKAAFGGNAPELPQWNGAPEILSASVYILYCSLVISITCGGLALAVRLASALNHYRVFHWFYFKVFPHVVWAAILLLWAAFTLLFVAATLQLPAVVDAQR